MFVAFGKQKDWSHQIIIQTSIKQKIFKQIINRKYFERGALTFFWVRNKKNKEVHSGPKTPLSALHGSLGSSSW